MEAEGGYLFGPDANLAGVDMTNMNLTGFNLTGANLQPSAGNHRTDLSFAHLDGAILAMAKMHLVYLNQADLTGANLLGAVITNANIAYGNWVGADLRGANLTGSGGIGSGINKATTDQTTTCTNGKPGPCKY